MFSQPIRIWRKHIPHLSVLFQPINEGTQKAARFVWNLEQKSLQQVQTMQTVLPLGSHDSADLIVLEVSVASRYALWSFWKALIDNQSDLWNFGTRLYCHLQTTMLLLILGLGEELIFNNGLPLSGHPATWTAHHELSGLDHQVV